MLAEDPVWFEELVISRLASDSGFVASMMPVLGFLLSENGKPEAIDDFETPQLNALFWALRHYHALSGFIISGRISQEVFGRCLQALSDQGRLVSIGEIPDRIQYMIGLVEKD